MAINTQRTQLYLGEQPQVFHLACQVAQAAKLEITRADPAYGTALLNTGMSMMSWGEDLRLQIYQAGPGVVSVSLSSGLKFGLVDWGRNNKNLDRFFVPLAQALQPAPPAWLPDPARRHQLRWWDGSTWSPNVSDGGQQGHDPIG